MNSIPDVTEGFYGLWVCFIFVASIGSAALLSNRLPRGCRRIAEFITAGTAGGAFAFWLLFGAQPQMWRFVSFGSKVPRSLRLTLVDEVWGYWFEDCNGLVWSTLLLGILLGVVIIQWRSRLARIPRRRKNAWNYNLFRH